MNEEDRGHVCLLLRREEEDMSTIVHSQSQPDRCKRRPEADVPSVSINAYTVRATGASNGLLREKSAP